MSDNPEIEALIAEYDEATVRAAFALAQHIKRKDITGIDFTGKAESEIRRQAHWRVKRDAERHANAELRRL